MKVYLNGCCLYYFCVLDGFDYLIGLVEGVVVYEVVIKFY